MSEVSPGQLVVFFNGRRPMKGKVEEIQEDGRVVVLIKTDGGTTRVLKDADEIKPFNDVKGQKAKIRFLE